MNKLERRLAGKKKANRLLRIYRGRNSKLSLERNGDFYNENGDFAHYLLKTRAPCSCPMCGNPRRYFGQVTRKEKMIVSEI